MSKILPIREPQTDRALKSLVKNEDLILYPNLTVSPDDTPHTFGCWMRLIDLGTDTAVRTCMFFGNTSNNRYQRIYYSRTTEQAACQINLTTTSSVYINHSVDDKWHFIAARYIQGEAVLYWDDQRNTGPNTRSPLGALQRAAFGGRLQYNDNNDGNLGGLMCHAWTVQQQLTDEQVEQIHRGIDPREVAPGIRYFPMTENLLCVSDPSIEKPILYGGARLVANHELAGVPKYIKPRTSYFPIPAAPVEYKPKYPDIFQSPIIGT